MSQIILAAKLHATAIRYRMDSEMIIIVGIRHS